MFYRIMSVNLCQLCFHLFLGFPIKFCVHFLSSNAHYMSCISHLPRLDHLYHILWKIFKILRVGIQKNSLTVIRTSNCDLRLLVNSRLQILHCIQTDVYTECPMENTHYQFPRLSHLYQILQTTVRYSCTGLLKTSWCCTQWKNNPW